MPISPPPAPGALHVLFRSLHRRLLLHRRTLAVLLGAVAVGLALVRVLGPAPAVERFWVAAHDLSAGSILTAADLVRAPFVPGHHPEGAVRDLDDRVLGHVLAVGLRRGEAITGSKLLGDTRFRPPGDRIPMAVHLEDAAVAALLRPGDRIDLLATDPRELHPPQLVARQARVLAVPEPAEGSFGEADGRLLVVAVRPEETDDLAAAATTRYLHVIWSR